MYVAVSDVHLFVEVSGPGVKAQVDRKVGGGLFALDAATGKQVWAAPPPNCGDRPRCSPAQSSAVSAIPGVVFSGSVDGHLRGYSTNDGTVVWDFNTGQDFKTVNGVTATEVRWTARARPFREECCSFPRAMDHGEAHRETRCWHFPWTETDSRVFIPQAVTESCAGECSHFQNSQRLQNDERVQITTGNRSCRGKWQS